MASSSSSSEGEEDESDVDFESHENKSAIIEEDIPKGNPTTRLAAVNLDWDNIRAVDILCVLQSFIPTTSEGSVSKVTIYPSEFGKERLQTEMTHGPAIFEFTPKEIDMEATRKDGDEIDTTALRKYQLERLRYYYAIIECSSISIAEALYKALDGAELGSTANILDLRFVPDDITFDDAPKDEATSVSDDHEPAAFVTDVLQHSRTKLTWDCDDPERKRLIADAFKKGGENDKLDGLLGSSDEEEEREEIREKYVRLLGGGDADEPSDAGGVEVTFPAIDSENHEGASNDRGRDESTIEKYVRKEQERKQRRNEKKSFKQSIERSTDLGFDDPFFDIAHSSDPKRKEKEAKQRVKKAAEEELARKSDDLTLLMHNNPDESLNHFNINHILRQQKISKHKKNKRRDVERENDLQEGFQMDVSDPRFADVFEGGDFAIDPSSSAFRKGMHGMEAILEESRRRKRQAAHQAPDVKAKKRKS